MEEVSVQEPEETIQRNGWLLLLRVVFTIVRVSLVVPMYCPTLFKFWNPIPRSVCHWKVASESEVDVVNWALLEMLTDWFIGCVANEILQQLPRLEKYKSLTSQESRARFQIPMSSIDPSKLYVDKSLQRLPTTISFISKSNKVDELSEGCPFIEMV